MFAVKIPIELANPNPDKIAATHGRLGVIVIKVMIPRDKGQRLVEFDSCFMELQEKNIALVESMLK